jgi:hypothetical protein
MVYGHQVDLQGYRSVEVICTGQKYQQGQELPEPLPVHPTIIQKAISFDFI